MARYLQQQALESDKGIHDYHFFNTYFYKKLQEALSCEVTFSSVSPLDGFIAKNECPSIISTMLCG